MAISDNFGNDPLTEFQLRQRPVKMEAEKLPLPEGAATSELQTTGNASLASIDEKATTEIARLTSILAKIIANPATDTLQGTGNTSLATIAGKDFATQTTLAAILTQLSVPQFKTRSDTFTIVASGTAVNTSTVPMGKFSLQVKATGAVTSWTVILEGSLDGTNFTTILTHTDIIGDGVTVFIGALTAPCLYLRSRCTAIVLGVGTNIVSTILGTV